MITAHPDRNDNRIHKKLYPECWVQDKHYETNIHYAHFHNIQKITSLFLEKTDGNQQSYTLSQTKVAFFSSNFETNFQPQTKNVFINYLVISGLLACNKVIHSI